MSMLRFNRFAIWWVVSWSRVGRVASTAAAEGKGREVITPGSAAGVEG